MISRTTRWKRVNRYGYTPGEAEHCPLGVPLWMYRIEQDEGMSVREILADSARTARQTGYTLRDLAREWGVKHNTLQHWAKKWSIHFPRGASALQRERASECIKQLNKTRRQK